MTAVSIAIALAAAFAFALASVLQQRAAADVPDEDALGAGLITRLVRRPLWLLGFLADTVGYLLQAVALIRGAILVVQPLLVTTLLFALPLGARFAGRRLGRMDWVWALTLSVALALFMAVGNPTEGIAAAPFADWVLPLSATAGLVAVCVGLAARTRGPNRSLLLAIASGVLYGVTGALTKSVMDAFDRGFVEGIDSLLVNWETYVLIVVISGGMFLQQSAYQAGNLEQALPAITVLEPVVAVVIGLTILDESVRVASVLGWAVLGLAVAGMTAGTIALSRSSAAHEQLLVDEIPGYTPG